MTSWLILVTHGTPKPELLAYVERQRQRIGFRLIHVRTDGGRGRYVADLNAFFEFSGYEEGLNTILAEYQDAPEKTLQLVFANDTFFGAHLHLYTDNLLDRLFAVSEAEAPIFIGTKHALPSDLAGPWDLNEYISTWCFGLIARATVLRRLSFVGIDQHDFRKTVWPSLPPPYRKAIHDWLNPTSFFKGWYKSIPGKPLDEATLWRKRFTIHLEHDLARKASVAGFLLRDAADGLPAIGRARTRSLRFFDRLLVNFLKLRSRLANRAAMCITTIA